MSGTVLNNLKIEEKEMEMKVGVRYIVTHDSKNKEFQVGDRVMLYEDGDIGNVTAAGWMPAEWVKEATEGMEVEVDPQWVAAKKEKAEKELKDLEDI